VSDETQTGDDNVRALPVQIDFDLDSYERAPEDVIPPLTIQLGGKVITFTNPDEIDWRDLVDMTNPVHFLTYSLSAEDRKHVMSLEIPAHKLGKLMEVYQDHFKIEDKIAAVQRSQRLSSIS
jgi:hypothetical protein